jgi:hypothetical protein
MSTDSRGTAQELDQRQLAAAAVITKSIESNIPTIVSGCVGAAHCTAQLFISFVFFLWCDTSFIFG